MALPGYFIIHVHTLYHLYLQLQSPQVHTSVVISPPCLAAGNVRAVAIIQSILAI